MKTASRSPGACFVVVAVCLLWTQEASARAGFQVDSDPFEVRLYDVDGVLEDARSGLPFELDCGRRTFLVEVEPRDLRSASFRARAQSRLGVRRVLPPSATLFRGRVVGDPESVVRLSFTRDGLHAYVHTNGEEFWVEPLETARVLLPNEPSAHKTITGGELTLEGTCAALELAPEFELPPEFDSSGEAVLVEDIAPAGAIRVVEIAIEADFEYFDLHGEDTVPAIEAVINVVDGIFEAELGLSITISSVIFYEEDIDAYDTSDPLALLQALKQNWNAQRANVHRDVVHLFTGRDLQGTTVGIAFVGEVCNLGGAYGLSQHLPSTTLMPLLVAHEIGHNFGAFHDPSDSDPKFIMNPVLSGATVQRFSDESKADIQAYVGKIACLSLEAPNDSTGGETTGGSGSTTTGGGGGGGGPIDPLVLVACIALALGEIKRRALATAR